MFCLIFMDPAVITYKQVNTIMRIILSHFNPKLQLNTYKMVENKLNNNHKTALLFLAFIIIFCILSELNHTPMPTHPRLEQIVRDSSSRSTVCNQP